MKEKVSKTEEEWREILTPEQYRVARRKGTERPFTGEFYRNRDAGTYLCAVVLKLKKSGEEGSEETA